MFVLFIVIKSIIRRHTKCWMIWLWFCMTVLSNKWKTRLRDIAFWHNITQCYIVHIIILSQSDNSYGAMKYSKRIKNYKINWMNQRLHTSRKMEDSTFGPFFKFLFFLCSMFVSIVLIFMLMWSWDLRRYWRTWLWWLSKIKWCVTWTRSFHALGYPQVRLQGL